jgi:hypothetical protein
VLAAGYDTTLCHTVRYRVGWSVQWVGSGGGWDHGAPLDSRCPGQVSKWKCYRCNSLFILCNPDVYCCVHCTSPLVPAVNQIIAVRDHPILFIFRHFNITAHLYFPFHFQPFLILCHVLCISVCSQCTAEAHNFFKNLAATSKKGDMQHVPYWEHPNIRHQCTNVYDQANLAPGIYAPLLYRTVVISGLWHWRGACQQTVCRRSPKGVTDACDLQFRDRYKAFVCDAVVICVNIIISVQSACF